VAREPAEQIATAQKELGKLLPWIDLSRGNGPPCASIAPNRCNPV
jgi:hypothetical protein